MEIKLAETELQLLAETYGDSSIKLEITGIDEFTIFHPKAMIPCQIIGFSSRTIRIRYQLGFFKNLLVNWFAKVEREGIAWNKKDKQVEIDPFSFLPEKEKQATEHFRIIDFSVKPGELLIRLGILPETSG